MSSIKDLIAPDGGAVTLFGPDTTARLAVNLQRPTVLVRRRDGQGEPYYVAATGVNKDTEEVISEPTKAPRAKLSRQRFTPRTELDLAAMTTDALRLLPEYAALADKPTKKEEIIASILALYA